MIDFIKLHFTHLFKQLLVENANLEKVTEFRCEIYLNLNALLKIIY